MLTKNSDAAESDTFEKLVEQIGPTIAALVGVSTSKYPGFLPGIRRALRRWELDVTFHAKPGSLSHAKSGEPDRLLQQMRKSVEVLHGQLQDIRENADPYIGEGQNNVLLNVGCKLEIELAELESAPLDGVCLADIERNISYLKAAVCRAQSRAKRSRGAPSDIDRSFPGLRSLVVSLQHMAQCSGGRRFTAHGRGTSGKGTMMMAINEISGFLLKRDDGFWARYLPTRDQHPVATYEKLIRYARPR